ncbi:unnamed protein product [Timema podura]|uniref:PUB domain-containing protein n=1 Tax=Timema podura TaxID=61482 RepID=A0ABN7P540_TIMPD|nr:unnamed protein product [Timema podura]
MSPNFSCIQSLEENSKDIYLETTTVLLKLIENVIQNPTNPKFRRIRLANPTVANKLLSAIGAMECLFEVGFQEGEDYLVLPNETPIESLTNFRNEVLQRRKVFLQQLASQTSGPASSSSLQGVSTSSHHSPALQPSPPRQQPLLQSSPPGICRVKYRESEPALAWRGSGKHQGKITPSSPERDSNLDLHILGSKAQLESRALANYFTKAGVKLLRRHSCNRLDCR